MGVIHTLYYYQVEKAEEDAKKEKERAAREQRQKQYQKNTMNKNNRSQMVRERLASRPSDVLNSKYSNITKEDLEDALDI